MDRQELRLVVPESVRAVPADLALVIGVTLLTVLVTTIPVIRETPLRIVLGLPFVLFLPGYAFVAALFPKRGTTATLEMDDNAVERDGGINGIERVALSFGLSIAIVPLLGLVLNFTPWGIRLTPIILSVSAFTIGGAVVATLRRRELPPEERFSVPYREWAVAGRAELFHPGNRTDTALNVLLALSLVLALASVGFAVASPQNGEQFTEFYLLTQDDDGELVASDYPERITWGEPESVIVGIENQEHESIDYTVVIQLERVAGEGNETSVTERQELDRFRTTVEHGETWQENRSVVPTLLGEDLRLTFLLYTDEPPAEPTRQNAYRSLHIWIDVVEETEDQQTASTNESSS